MASQKEPLSVTHPELAAQADGWDPTTLTAGSNKNVKWICSSGHQWEVSPNNRTQKSITGCPYCAGKRAITGINDFATLHPAIANEADGWDPLLYLPMSNKKMSWRCTKGHTWDAAIVDRVCGDGCPICANRVLVKGQNDLRTLHPAIANEADGWDPGSVIAGGHSRRRWKCEKGHVWETLVKKRISGQGCPTCTGQKVMSGFNDLATTNPLIANEADGWDPTEFTSHSGLKKSWKCPLGHTYVATIDKRSNGRGCPSCAQTGFDPNMDGWLYLIDHDALSLFQIGISNFPENRLGQHSKRGWEVMEVRGPMEGQIARKLETAILHAVERRGAVLGHKAEIEKFDGYSEAWTKDSLTVNGFKQLLDWVYEDDKNIVQ